MRMASTAPGDEPLLGEQAGKWYWDQARGEFRKNRRLQRDRRSFSWELFWKRLCYQLLDS